MSVENRISQLIWKSEAPTVPVKPQPKPEIEPEPVAPDIQDSVGEKATKPPVV